MNRLSVIINTIMKKIAFLSILSAFLILSCKKENLVPGAVNGTISGPDPRTCPCCGGNFIVIGDSVNGQATSYRIESVPASSGINLQNGPFPILVTLTYTVDTTRCPGMYIKSDYMRRR
jgi:hypothetical protein